MTQASPAWSTLGTPAGPNKVWKKQPGGPPALPPATRDEIKEGLSGISTTDFEGQVRSLLVTINSGADCDSDDGGCSGPPSSFPVETVCQVGEGIFWERLRAISVEAVHHRIANTIITGFHPFVLVLWLLFSFVRFRVKAGCVCLDLVMARVPCPRHAELCLAVMSCHGTLLFLFRVQDDAWSTSALYPEQCNRS